MTAFSKLQNVGRLGGVIGFVMIALAIRKYGDKAARGALNTLAKSEKDGSVIKEPRDKAGIDGQLFVRLYKIIKIVIPKFFSIEMGYVILSAFTMVVRTYYDVWVLKTQTRIESSIIAQDGANFAKYLALFLVGVAPLSIINGVLKYSLKELAICCRTNLTQYAYERYLKGFTYYKISNLDNRISNPDQLLSNDIEKFSESISNVYSSMLKPMLDIVVYFSSLSSSHGVSSPLSMLLYLAVSGFALTWLRKPTGALTMREQKLEGEFRYVNSRLITYSEEVAFYQGNKRESWIIDESFTRLINLLRKSQRFRFMMGAVDSMVAKYGATCVGFFLVSRPFLVPGAAMDALKSLTHEERVNSYYTSGRMLVKLSSAMGQLVLSGRELTRLSGFTSRVTDFLSVLDEVAKGGYKRTMLSDANGVVAKPSGTIEYKDNVIEFVNVPLTTPNGDVLIKSLSFKVESGMNVLVSGPNGCGKSSLFRTLGELWPVFGGKVIKPQGNKLFYIPQKPYLTLGTLRDQIIYPDTLSDMKLKNINDIQLAEILEQVMLKDILVREGWESIQDWADILSGGEKQRLAMARVFYHKPQFAILDECTSAVSVDVEGFMYKHCQELGITLFTVSHRKSLWEHHEYVLSFDGRGSYSFKKIENAEVFGS